MFLALAIVFLALGVIALILGARRIASCTLRIAKVLFIVAIIIVVVTLHRSRPKPPPKAYQAPEIELETFQQADGLFACGSVMGLAA